MPEVFFDRYWFNKSVGKSGDRNTTTWQLLFWKQVMKSFRAHKTGSTETAEQKIGSRLLLSGQELTMWRWQVTPAANAEVNTRTSQDYEVMGYVISGRAELHVDGRVIPLGPGDSWVVPTGAPHAYVILEPLTAIKTSHPPANKVY